ncbi:hypothetical protein [Microtetraspora sp. AC03309]|uniref:hypothetical protein n=1 Tax=Microtetraspora sp. AC03309 TaxID=2779376 RepID=UPI001E286960|nr:hypothetical protein [Microtetraspora sp. AC03309]
MSQAPSVGRIVHYVSYGTPNGEYKSECRAAIITGVDDYQAGEGGGGLHVGHVSLAVLNPEGMFFNRAVLHDEGAETPGSPDCPDKGSHGNPFRYCVCGWIEGAHRGGTWHWPERA